MQYIPQLHSSPYSDNLRTKTVSIAFILDSLGTSHNNKCPSIDITVHIKRQCETSFYFMYKTLSCLHPKDLKFNIQSKHHSNNLLFNVIYPHRVSFSGFLLQSVLYSCVIQKCTYRQGVRLHRFDRILSKPCTLYVFCQQANMYKLNLQDSKQAIVCKQNPITLIKSHQRKNPRFGTYWHVQFCKFKHLMIQRDQCIPGLVAIRDPDLDVLVNRER